MAKKKAAKKLKPVPPKKRGAKPLKKAEARKAKAEAREAAEAVKPAVILETDKSRSLCETISLESDGTCFLGFSRGKDSIAAWLYLRRFFKRVIPFHVATVPGLGFVDRSLAYYEAFFQTPVLRLMDGDVIKDLNRMIYQPESDEAEIDDLELWTYNKHNILDLLRKVYNIPNAWGAFGINMTDSLDRRIYVAQCQGRHDTWKTFYPCWDWTKEQILASINAVGLALPGDYLLASRTVAGTPSYRHIKRMRDMYPEDFEKITHMFPYVYAELARQEFREAMPRFQNAVKTKKIKAA